MAMPFFVPERKETEESETTKTENENSIMTEQESAIEAETQVENETGTQTETEAEILKDGNEQEGSFVSNLNMNIIVPSAVGGMVVLVLLIVLMSSKKKKKSEKTVPAKTNNNDEHTEFLGDHTELIDDDDATEMADTITIRLIDKKRPSQIHSSVYL